MVYGMYVPHCSKLPEIDLLKGARIKYKKKSPKNPPKIPFFLISQFFGNLKKKIM
jgi:hypothetical protein